MNEKIVLIDGHSILNRAFFGIPDLTNSEGLHTNAVYGFLNILFKILEEENPEYLMVAFDRSEPTFRHTMYEAYKGTRKPMLPELKEQVPLIREVLTAMQVPVMDKPGYEADDILGTIARRAEAEGMIVRIISGDRDLLQLATDKTMVRIPKTKRTGTEIEDYLAADVKERYKVTPEEFIDVKALMGDSSDNIPGVPGIGEKTATSLIVEYHSIENAWAHIDEITNKRAQNNLREHYDMAEMSKVLATIRTDSPIEFDFSDAKIGNLFTPEAYPLFKRLEFKNMLARFEGDFSSNKAEESFLIIREKAQLDAFLKKLDLSRVAVSVYENEGWKEKEAAPRLYGAAISDGHSLTAFVFVGLPEASADGIAAAETSASANEKNAAAPDNSKQAASSDSPADPVTESILLTALTNLCQKTEHLITPDLKKLLSVTGITDKIQGCDDTSVAAYLLNPLKNSYLYDDLAGEYLNEMVPSFADLFGKLKPEKAMEKEPEAFAKMGCYEAYVSAKVCGALKKSLEETGMEELYQTVEMPLVYVLADMEREGVRIDGEALHEYGENLTGRIASLEASIYEQAGEKFNINSPKQLGLILFEKLQMPHAKKTKTGYSTAADVLEKLAPEYPIVSDILEYRTLSKLKSTYADGLANFIEADGRIHTSFKQTVTATGRLSSTDPNLQNIPIRMEEGRMIRKVFIPKDGYVFVDADYSQIELRVLAHMSDDENLIEAYRQAEDIHRMTASLVFHTPFEEVTPLQRRNAKAVNFGIVYGISSFGLSQDLSITRKEAEEYINRYFETYPGIRAFLDRAVSDAKEKGYAVTMYGRRRPVPELTSGNFMQRQFGERIAMNSPIQGTAADIIKIAMIRVADRLKKEGLRAKLILQVHDELLIEAPEDEEEQVRQLLSEEMRGAAKLKVDLEVGMESGKDWYEAH